MDDYNRDNEIIDDRYKIMETAGAGGMATVYRAHDLITDKDVAIKMMRPETASNKTNLSRFEREARAAASLNHQNIVKVLNVGSHQNLPFIVTEYVDGQNLRQVLEIRGKFSFMEALDIMYQLCSAVMYSHSHGIIHRDIKPQNIFLTSDGIIKLGDFGIATFQNSTHVTRQENLIGSIHYVSPEFAKGNPATPRSDIYAMGITFFELITGRVPFDSENVMAIASMHIFNKFPSVRKYNPKCPECIENIIYKACEKKPSDRYASAELMRKDIEKILNNPSLLDKKNSFFYTLFHPTSATNKQRREEKEQKKALKKAAKEAKKENELK
jgi:serine/threonine-protein kinase